MYSWGELQPHYNLAHREEVEHELMPLCEEEGLGVIPYSPLAGGFLTGKYRRDEPIPDSDRADSVRRRYFNERGWRIVDKLDEVAGHHGATLPQVAVAWLLANPVVTAPIIGANSVKQLSETLPAVDLELSDEDIQALDAVSNWREG